MTGLNVAPPGLLVRLSSGSRILLRPIAPEDREHLHRGMAALSVTARRHRFFTAMGDLDEDMVSYLTEIDYRSHFAWVAVDLDRSGQPVVAVGRYVSLEGALADEALADEALADTKVADTKGADPKVAEVAFVVGDDYQRQGLATILLELLSIVGAANGFDQFFARVLADNAAMRHILTKAGAKLRPDDAGVLRTTFDVPVTTGRFPVAEVLATARAAAERSPADRRSLATSTNARGRSRCPD